MLRLDYSKWKQSPADLLRLALESEHVRSRERYQALYMIGSGQYNATEWADLIERENETVQGWVHKYNEQGPTGVGYQHSGGRPPFLPRRRGSAL